MYNGQTQKKTIKTETYAQHPMQAVKGLFQAKPSFAMQSQARRGSMTFLLDEVWHVLALVTFGGIASMGADFEHFTWWSITSFALYATLHAIDYHRYFFWTFQTIQILVITGVIIMGATNCDVFEQAFEDNGAVVYILGNFLMHYFPSVVALARRFFAALEAVCDKHGPPTDSSQYGTFSTIPGRCTDATYPTNSGKLACWRSFFSSHSSPTLSTAHHPS